MDCPVVLYHLMMACWQKDRNSRPKFEEIVCILDKLIRNPSSLKALVNSSHRVSNLVEPGSVDSEASVSASVALMEATGYQSGGLREATGYQSIEEWLKGIKMGRYVELFMDSGYTSVEVVSHMTLDDLRRVGVNLVGHQKKIINSIQEMRVSLVNNTIPI